MKTKYKKYYTAILVVVSLILVSVFLFLYLDKNKSPSEKKLPVGVTFVDATCDSEGKLKNELSGPDCVPAFYYLNKEVFNISYSKESEDEYFANLKNICDSVGGFYKKEVFVGGFAGFSDLCLAFREDLE